MPRPLRVTGMPRAIEVSSVPPPAIRVASFVRHSYLEPLGLPVTAKPKLLGDTRKALSKPGNDRARVGSGNARVSTVVGQRDIQANQPPPRIPSCLPRLQQNWRESRLNHREMDREASRA